MFEMGFADGLSRPTICVTENRELVGAFPAWLTRGQLGSFEDGETMRHLLNGMATILGNARLLRRRPAHGTSPERIVWLRDALWAQQAKAEFSRLVQSDGRTLSAFDDTQLDPTCLQQASTATLMVGILDGTDADVFVHYTCGIMMADPKAGWGPTKKLARQAIIVLPDHLEAKTVAPKSALHCHPTITYCHASELRVHAIDALRRYQEWSIPENGRSK